MQTFLPYVSFESSARVLDRQRLGKQRVETLQIMKALTLGVGWVNHPVTKMWRGYEGTLMNYQTAVILEWTSRGYKDTCHDKTLELYHELVGRKDPRIDPPPWLGLRKFHSRHRANLLRKDPTWYGQFGWPEKPGEGYWYPPPSRP